MAAPIPVGSRRIGFTLLEPLGINLRVGQVKQISNFDTQIKRYQIAERRYLFRVGGKARSEMIQLIKYRKKASRPGEPPAAHEQGKGGIRYIRFAVDFPKRSVVIGPVRFRPKPVNVDGQPAPSTLDRGGVILSRSQSRRGRRNSGDRGGRQRGIGNRLEQRLRGLTTNNINRRRGAGENIFRIAPRPYRAPAFKNTRPHAREIMLQEFSFFGRG